MENNEVILSDHANFLYNSLSKETRAICRIMKSPPTILLISGKEETVINDFNVVIDIAYEMSVEGLDLSNVTIIKYFTSLSLLKNTLKYLELSDVILANKEDIKVLKELYLLKELVISATDSSPLQGLTLDLKYLESLTIEYPESNIQDISFIEGMDSLNTLFVNETAITSIKPVLTLHKSIKLINCTDSPFLTEEHVQSIREQLPNHVFFHSGQGNPLLGSAK